MLGGWRLSFYVLGVLSLVWAVVWVRFYRDVPREHPRTTETELAELPNRGAAPERQTGTPWRAMLVALFPVLIVDFCYGWLLWVYLTWLPSLFKDEFGLKLGQFALYTSLVLLAGVAGDLVGGRLSDELLRRRDPVVARRLPLVLGLTASLVCLAPVLVVHSLLATTISLALAFFFLELTNSTIWALPMDVAPDHAGCGQRPGEHRVRDRRRDLAVGRRDHPRPQRRRLAGPDAAVRGDPRDRRPVRPAGGPPAPGDEHACRGVRGRGRGSQRRSTTSASGTGR